MCRLPVLDQLHLMADERPSALMRIESVGAAGPGRDGELDVDLGDVALREVERDVAHELVPDARVGPVGADHEIGLDAPALGLAVDLEHERAPVEAGADELVAEAETEPVRAEGLAFVEQGRVELAPVDRVDRLKVPSQLEDPTTAKSRTGLTSAKARSVLPNERTWPSAL